MVEQTEILDCR
uniref:Uncharacterized protein n=1 Tax=Rhizophora mucronata TaxID=61149 RepID=A0A2P2P5P2_RHIMU